jgi:two-component system phosphate regulon sensor histidine kinase PhoR
VEEHLRMLLDNLLSNAVLYSHEGGTVHVTCAEQPDGGATLTVEDHGIGIVQEKLPRIFDEYYRTDEAARFNKESTGLGLTIVRHVAEAHGIGVRVESRLGEGTKFRLRFPPSGRSAAGRTHGPPAGRPGGPSDRGREEAQDGLPDGR